MMLILFMNMLIIIFEACLTVANHKLKFELDSAARFISDKKKRLVDSFKSYKSYKVFNFSR